MSNRTEDYDALAAELIAAARGIDKLEWLLDGTERIGFPIDRYILGSSFSYTRAALDLAREGVTWSRICRWKS